MRKDFFSTGNKKYKHYGRKLLTFGLPAHRSRSGLFTCPGAGKCIIGCYAQQGWYRSSRVRDVQEERLKLARSGEKMVDTLHAELCRRKPKFVRIHDSGDFFDSEYLERWIKLALMHPEMTFFTYSKMVPMIMARTNAPSNLWHPMPPNLYIVLSEGGIWDHLINQDQDLFARVFKNNNQLRRAGFVNGGTDDLKLILKGHKKIGLVYHGYNNRRFDTSH
ncbi:MAG TPA: hypothetical protein ENI05_04435 [Porticoccus sp.]|nr:hypothetical protein [Porticoccus sp.]